MRTRALLPIVLLAIACGGNVDGDGGRAAGGSGGTSASGGSAGLSECDSIQAKYGVAFGTAASCNPADETPECTHPLKSALSCGCSTYVNGANSAALEELSALEADWLAAGCVIPCPSGCPAPQDAVCQQNGDGAGKCSPVY